MSLSCSEHCRARGCLESRQPFWRVEVSRKRRWSEDGALMSQLWNCPTLGRVIIWASTYPYLSSCHVLEALFRELKASWMIQRSIPNHTWWIIRIARIKKKIPKSFQRGKRDGPQRNDSQASSGLAALQDAGIPQSKACRHWGKTASV